MEESTPQGRALLKDKRVHAAVVVALLIGAAAVVGAASATPCSREVVQGNLDGEAQFTAREVIVYAAGMFPGNPVVVRLEGYAADAGWYSVRLPGVRALDQLRVVGDGPRVGGYFLEDGTLHFSVDMDEGGAPGPVEIFYIAGSASWSHHYELDFARSTLALIGRVDWNAKAMFRQVDMLFVSGKLHAVPQNAWQATEAPAAAGGSLFGFSSRVADANTDGLAAFSVPSASDEGIYVVHRAAGVDMPGSNGHGLRSCQPTAFYIRVHSSPVELQEIAVVGDSQLSATANGTMQGSARLELEVVNRGDLPWMPGRADIYRSRILAGADDLPYTARNGTVRIEMGSAFDIELTRTVEQAGNKVFHNYTVHNADVSPYTVEVVSVPGGPVGDAGAFTRDGGLLKARGLLAAGATVTVGWWAPA